MESQKPMFQVENFDDEFVQKLVYDALVWCSLHGLVVGDKTYQVSCCPPLSSSRLLMFQSDNHEVWA